MNCGDESSTDKMAICVAQAQKICLAIQYDKLKQSVANGDLKGEMLVKLLSYYET